jgi:hypothetical protein
MTVSSELKSLGKEFLYEACCTIRFLRRFYTEKRLAEQLGTSPSTLSRCSRGKQPLQPPLLPKVLDVIRGLFAGGQVDLRRLLAEMAGDSDFLCTLGVMAVVEMARSSFSFETILAFQDPITLSAAYILSKYLNARISTVFISPTIAHRQLYCLPLRVGSEELFMPVCLSYPSRRGLRRTNAILLTPPALSDFTIASRIAEELSHIYSIKAILALLCGKPGEQAGSVKLICIP